LSVVDTAGLREAASALDDMTDADILDGLHAVFAAGLEDGGWIDRAATRLAHERGESAAMIRFGLRRSAAAHLRPHLERQWSEARMEAARHPAHRTQTEAATRPAPSARPEAAVYPTHSAQAEAGGRSARPRLVLQVLAGNVPGLAFPAAVSTLLARCAGILKPARDERVTASAFHEALRFHAPALARALDVRYWTGGDSSVEDELLAAVDWIVVSGEGATLEALRHRAPGTTLHGPRWSLGVVGENPGQGWAGKVAREVCLHEQRGCLSPHFVFVADEPAAAGRELARAMAERQSEWPAAKRPEETSGVLAARAAASLRGGSVLDPGTADWTVLVDPDPVWEPGPGGRCLRVAPYPGDTDFFRRLRETSKSIQVVGFMGCDDRLLRTATDCGVPWVTSLDAIQDPPAGWRADGRSELAELLGAEAGDS